MSPVEIAEAVHRRHREVLALLSELSLGQLRAPSLLPGWDRLTIACHLRYGAAATSAMTVDALNQRAASFYPEGRSVQRPLTLAPRDGEQPEDVIASLGDASRRLDSLWATLQPQQWQTVVREPPDNPDLGPTTVAMLALLRLTEVEVHGQDLDIGASRWSPVFVDAALLMRLRWLETRRSNHGTADEQAVGSWRLESTDGPAFVISASPEGVTVVESDEASADVTITGSKASILGFLLGRVGLVDLGVLGDERRAREFHQAFPAP